ncbi:MAG TPA: hypothetical protein VH519_09945 [Hyphomicrobiaceae bacterium]
MKLFSGPVTVCHVAGSADTVAVGAEVGTCDGGWGGATLVAAVPGGLAASGDWL